MKSSFERADEATNGFLSEIKGLLSDSLTANVEKFQAANATPLQLYESAEVMRLIFAAAYQANHRLTAIANNLKIEDVG